MSDVPMPIDPLPDDPWTRLNQRPCRNLRSKEMFYDNGIPVEDRGSSGIFWCSQTYRCLGPDSLTVSTEECGPERSCFER